MLHSPFLSQGATVPFRIPSGPARHFHFQARNNDGLLISGYVQARDPSSAVRGLLDRGYAVLEVVERELPRTGRRRLRFDALSTLEPLAVFTRQLAVLNSSTIRIDRALGILAAQAEDRWFASTLEKVHRDVRNGMSLSRALARQTHYFTPEYVALVEAGERSGTLPRTLERMAGTLEGRLELAGRVRAALSYPFLIFAMMLLVNLGLFSVLIPRFQPLLESLGIPLPFMTRALFSLSMLTQEPAFWLAMVSGLALLALGLRRLKRRPATRMALDRWRLGLPIFGPLYRNWVLAESFAVMADTAAAGLLMDQSLALAGRAANSPVYEEAFDAVRVDMLRGRGFSQGFARQGPLFPRFVVQMMTLVEECGAMDRGFAKVAEYYRRELEAALRNLTSAMEPLMIVLLGGLTAAVVIGLFVPLYRVMASFL